MVFKVTRMFVAIALSTATFAMSESAIQSSIENRFSELAKIVKDYGHSEAFKFLNGQASVVSTQKEDKTLLMETITGPDTNGAGNIVCVEDSAVVTGASDPTKIGQKDPTAAKAIDALKKLSAVEQEKVTFVDGNNKVVAWGRAAFAGSKGKSEEKKWMCYITYPIDVPGSDKSKDAVAPVPAKTN